jgi:hypothetical protein
MSLVEAWCRGEFRNHISLTELAISRFRPIQSEETLMTNFLPALHEGHAPITLQTLFRDALEAYDDWEEGMPEPIVSFEDKVLPVSAVFEWMRPCTDLMPANMIGIVTDRLTKPWSGAGPLDAMTFSTAARVMSILVRRRLRRFGRGSIEAFAERFSHPMHSVPSPSPDSAGSRPAGL